MKVFLVMGDNDEAYEDYSEFRLGVFSEREKADDFIKKYKEAQYKAQDIEIELNNNRDDYGRYDEAKWTAAYEAYRKAWDELEKEVGFGVMLAVKNFDVEVFVLDQEGE